MSFLSKALTGIGNSGSYRISLDDEVVVFCHHGFRCEGTLVAHTQEGIVLDLDCVYLWVNADWIGSIGKVKQGGGGGNGGPDEVPEEALPKAKKKKKRSPAGESDGTEALKKVFCNGTR